MKTRVHIKKGLDIPLAGVPEQTIHPGQVTRHVALCGLDYPGLKPRLLVQAGDAVVTGQPLFIDKRDPVVQYTAPGQGTVVAVNRGARRVLESVVIALEDSAVEQLSFRPLSDRDLRLMDRQSVASRLQETGLWTALRTRPYSQVPLSDSKPHSIFVNAIDTRPLAADPQIIIAPQTKAFASGLIALSALTEGAIWLCTATDWHLPLPETDRLQQVEFAGPHPAGLPGTHIHHLDPVGAGRRVWHIGYQDVIAIGHLFGAGCFNHQRTISLAGGGVRQPRLVHTRLGASCDELVKNELHNADACRVISGSVLGGHIAIGSRAYLGRYHQQISVIPEGRGRHRFGWLSLRPNDYTALGVFLKKTGHDRKVNFTTAQKGRFSGMLTLSLFGKIMPLDILPSPLFRALLVKDTDQAQALGCLELDEEDLALCSFVCPAKYDYGAILRINLEQIERQG